MCVSTGALMPLPASCLGHTGTPVLHLHAMPAALLGTCLPMCFHRVANPAMPMLSVAPEGTLSHGRCVLTFKRGAFVAGVPVLPFVLRYKLTPHNPAWTIIIPFWHVVSLVTYIQSVQGGYCHLTLLLCALQTFACPPFLQVHCVCCWH